MGDEDLGHSRLNLSEGAAAHLIDRASGNFSGKRLCTGRRLVQRRTMNVRAISIKRIQNI
jgi:hypothetical protein